MPATETRTEPSICRFCHAACAILVDVEDGRAVRVLGDRENPIYHGYTCAKGRALPEQHFRRAWSEIEAANRRTGIGDDLEIADFDPADAT